MPPKQISSKLRPEIPTIPYSNSICYECFIFHFCAGRYIPYLPLWTWTGQQLLPVEGGGGCRTFINVASTDEWREGACTAKAALTFVAHMDWSRGWKSLKQKPSFLEGRSSSWQVFSSIVPTHWLPCYGTNTLNYQQRKGKTCCFVCLFFNQDCHLKCSSHGTIVLKVRKYEKVI